MAATPLGAFVYQSNLPYVTQREAKPNSTHASDTGTVIAGCFCKFSTNAAGSLIRSATDDTVVWGFATTSTPGATPEPYTAPYQIPGAVASNTTNFTSDVIDVQNTKFVVNLVTSGAAPTLGTAYELVVTSGVPYLDTAATTNDFLVPEALYPGDVATDDNPRYICSVVATRQ
jgi:hypothetical protein